MRLPTPCLYCGAPEMDVVRMLVECRPDNSGQMNQESIRYLLRCPKCGRETDSDVPADKQQS